MGVIGRSNIITDNLLIAFDSANYKSYDSTLVTPPTTLYDLSGNNNDGTIYNLPTYSDSLYGSLYFDGTNEYVNIPYNSSFDFSLAQTLFIWLKPGTGADSARRNPYNQAYGGSGTITHEVLGSFNYFFGTNGSNGQPYAGRNSGFTVEPNELACICVTRSQTLNKCDWYKNGSLIRASNAGGYTTTNNGSSAIWIAAGYRDNFIGDIYCIYVYNRFFTEDEVSQMYQSTRYRFGM